MGVRVREKVPGSGEWWVFVSHKGRRRSKKVGDKRAANAVKREVEERLSKGDMGMIREKCPTLAKYGKQWLDSPLNKWTDRTSKDYTLLFNNHIVPTLGSMRIDDVDVGDVIKLLEGVVGKGLSASTAGGILNVLSGIFERARIDKLVTHNPCVKLGKWCGKSKKKVNPLSAQQLHEILENCKHLPLTLQTLFLVMARTGLRIGEALALQWSDIDFDNRLATVSKSYDYKNRQVKDTKTYEKRKVRLTKQAIEALKSLRESTMGIGFVFTDRQGEPLKYDYVSKNFKRIRPRNVTLHDLRHTYATLRLAKGDNPVDVSNQLGHASTQTTYDIYTHWIPQQDYVHQTDELDTLHLSAPYVQPASTEAHGYH